MSPAAKSVVDENFRSVVSMKISVYGANKGRLVVYFHGAPGSMSECAILDGPAKQQGLKVVCFDRFSLDCCDDRDAYYQTMATEILEILGDEETVDLVGFSIGAFVALEVSKRLGKRVENIHLISAAAPLSGGNYIDKMAGGFVFRLADRHPRIFYFLTQYQKLLSALAPKTLFKILFASAEGQDMDLSKEKNFQQLIIPTLVACFKTGSAGYMADVKSYVRWDDDLSWCHARTTNWHGTLDNWSPFEMASALQEAIPGAVNLEALEGLSHYSCLLEAAPRLAVQLSRE